MKDPYIILGIDRYAGAEAITARYEELKRYLYEARFLPGQEGNDAAQKLSELEDAWVIIQGDIEKQRQSEQFGGDYGYIDELIKQARFDEAQKLLDTIAPRTAEWHYLQSIIFYRREWIADSRTQLERAVAMDPSNQKYRAALDRMIQIMGNPQADPAAFGMQYGQPPPNQPTTDQHCANCCLAYLCTNCLCNLMRCC